MSLPEGVTTCTVVAGVPVTHTGAGVKTFVSIEPSVFLVHAATGTPLVDFVEELNISEGVAGQFTLPHTDQAGFQDENGNAYTNWYYTARVTYSTPSKAKNKTPKVKVFQLTTGQSTVDLDLLPSGAPALPYIAPSATVTAFGGRTGAVTLQESDLPGRLSDASLSATYANKNDPGLPIDEPTTLASNDLKYFEADVSPSGKMWHGKATDGTFHVPRLRTDKVLAGDVTFVSDPLTSPMDLIINAGQSNTGYPDPRPAGVPIPDPDPRILYWNEVDETIQTWTQYSVNVRQTAVYYTAVEYVRRYLAPGRSVLIVPAGMGSTGFSTTTLASPPAGYASGYPGTWDRTLTADPVNLYTRMVYRTNRAMATAPSGSKLAFLQWSQGESDTDFGRRTQSQYAALLDDLIATFRTDIARTDLPVVVGSMVPEWTAQDANRIAIARAHEDTPRRMERTAYAWGPVNLPDFSGEIHWSHQGQQARGPLFIAALYRALCNVTGSEPIPPQNVRAQRWGGDLVVEWEHPPCRIDSFTLEYKIDAGAWTAVALLDATSRTATLALALTAANKVSVRLRTTNSVGTSINTMEVKA